MSEAEIMFWLAYGMFTGALVVNELARRTLDDMRQREREWRALCDEAKAYAVAANAISRTVQEAAALYKIGAQTEAFELLSGINAPAGRPKA